MLGWAVVKDFSSTMFDFEKIICIIYDESERGEMYYISAPLDPFLKTRRFEDGPVKEAK